MTKITRQQTHSEGVSPPGGGQAGSKPKSYPLRGLLARFSNFLEDERGLTLMELVIVIALSSIIVVLGFGAWQEVKSRKDLELSLNEISSAVRSARDKSVTQEDGNRWSVRFNSSSTSSDRYEIYTGASYTTSSVQSTHFFRRAVEFSEPANGRIIDLQFEPVSGKLPNKKIISITNERQTSRAGDIILNTLGLLTERLEDNIVGYWHFDEGTGTSTFDASGNGNIGTLTNSPTWAAASSCKAGQCLSFDGANDWVQITGDVNLTGAMTLEFWFYTPDKNANEYFFDNRSPGSWWFIKNYTGGTCGSVSNNICFENRLVADGSDWSTNEWTHIAVTDDTSTAKMYINGELVDTGAGESTTISTNLRIGARFSDSNYFEGRIDHVRLYNTALSSSTIKSHYEDLR